jgi:hypothetical protein
VLVAAEREIVQSMQPPFPGHPPVVLCRYARAIARRGVRGRVVWDSLANENIVEEWWREVKRYVSILYGMPAALCVPAAVMLASDENA